MPSDCFRGPSNDDEMEDLVSRWRDPDDGKRPSANPTPIPTLEKMLLARLRQARAEVKEVEQLLRNYDIKF
jgi:hypothetical protein